ncbi:MAG: co-chaperone GroES family protein [Bernardetiaceae bacterium]|jgi:co-chaperonin GroES (HSP10)|nr:co-chaperone GroES family protein [Bernardetiaceae bacterium]
MKTELAEKEINPLIINKLDNLIVVGDRVLLKPKTPDERTSTGLYLPPSVQENEKVQSGYVMKVGPGYAIPSADDEAWKPEEDRVKYLPLQARPGDLAIFLQKSAIELVYGGEKYFIVPQQAILLLERDPDLFG